MAQVEANTVPLTPSTPPPGQVSSNTTPPGGSVVAAQTTKETPKTDERVSPKLLALARRDRESLERVEAAKAKEAEIAAKEESLKAREASIAEFESLKGTNPLKALEMLGLTYQELTQIALNDGQVGPEQQIKKVEAKIDGFLSQQEKDRQAAEEKAKSDAVAEEREAIENFQKDIVNFCTENAKKYELIQFEGRQQLVYDVIDEHYNRTIDPKTGRGKVMSIAEAADKVEAFLDKKYNEAFALEKFKSKVVPPKPVTKSITTPTGREPQTLNNRMSATPTLPVARILTDEERIQKAISYARGLRP